MGNIAFVSFKKNIDEHWLFDECQKINQDRFDGKLSIAIDHGYIRISSPDPSCYATIDYFFYGKRKIGGKHPCDQWLGYVFGVYSNELAFRHNGLCSDEGVEGAWKGNPSKYSSCLEWIRYKFMGCRTDITIEDRKKLQYLIDMAKKYIPKGLENK